MQATVANQHDGKESRSGFSLDWGLRAPTRFNSLIFLFLSFCLTYLIHTVAQFILLAPTLANPYLACSCPFARSTATSATAWATTACSRCCETRDEKEGTSYSRQDR